MRKKNRNTLTTTAIAFLKYFGIFYLSCTILRLVKNMFIFHVLFYLQMEKLDLSQNDDISDAGAAMLLGCLGNLKRLMLIRCNISLEMTEKLEESGREVGCNVAV